MRRSALLVIIAVAILGGALYWGLSRRSTLPSRVAKTESQRQSEAWLALRVQAFTAGPEDDVLLEVTAYDRRARQAEIVREAAQRGYRGPAASAQVPAARVLPAGWPSRLRIESGQTVLAHEVVTTAGDGASAVVRLTTRAGAAQVVAVLSYDEGEARSNTASLAPTADAPVDRLVARGRQAELIADQDRLAVLGAELMALEPASPWGHYFAGAALEARGDREAARAAFSRALALTTSGFEAPIGLVARIRLLGG